MFLHSDLRVPPTKPSHPRALGSLGARKTSSHFVHPDMWRFIFFFLLGASASRRGTGSFRSAPSLYIQGPHILPHRPLQQIHIEHSAPRLYKLTQILLP